MTDVLQRLRTALDGLYAVEREVGRGGMALVFLAEDVKHGRKVALKVLRPDLATAIGPDRFLREISLTARLQHPYILPLLDSGQTDGLLYYVMPFVAGETLRDRLNRERQLPIKDALTIAIQVARALDYASQNDIVHRDIKPENIMLAGGEAVVADFGVARAVSAAGETELTATGTTIGTPTYMSPEQAAGGRELDGRSDQYALACVLYEMLAGDPPFTAQNADSVIRQHLLAEPPSVAILRSSVPERLVTVLSTALGKAPADRFRTNGEFASALESIGAVLPTLEPAVPKPPARRGRRRVMPYTMVAVVALAIMVASWAVWQTRVSPQVEVAAGRVAVFPFVYHGGEAYSHLGNGMAGLLSTVLDGVGPLRTVDQGAVLAAVERDDRGSLSLERASAIAQRFGAGRFVVGSVQEAGGRVTITASAYNASSSLREASRATADGDATSDLFRLVNEVTVRLLGAFGIQEPARRLESLSTSSVVALSEYLKGEIALRRGDPLGAITALQRAVAADSLFALAWYRLAYAISFTGASEQVEAPLRRAIALAAHLSERDRRLAEALAAAAQADAERANRLYESLVFDYPDDVDARFGLADVLLHSGPIYGLAMDSVREYFQRVLDLDPTHPEALVHLPWAAGLLEDVAGVDSSVARALVAEPEGFMAPVFRAVLAFVRNDASALERTVAELQTVEDNFRRMAVVFFVRPLGNLPRTDSIVTRLFIQPARPPDVRAFGHLIKAHLELGMGRAKAALAQLQVAATFDSAAALEDRALLSLLPFVPVTADELRSLRGELERWNAAKVAPSVTGSPWFAPHDGLHRQLRLYLLGAVSIRLGDGDAARRYASSLMNDDTTSAEGMIARMLSHNVRGLVAYAEGRHAAALAEFQRSGLRGWQSRAWERTFSSPFFSQSYERFVRAEALEALGRTEEARQWYASLWMANNFDTVFLAQSHLKQGELYDRAGNRDRAAAHYQRFLELRQDSYPEFAWPVQRVSQRLSQLAAAH